METRLKELSDQRPIPVHIVPSMDGGDDINLIDLWRVIARRGWIILLALIVSLLVALGYLFFTQPLYTAVSHLLPPQRENIQALLIDFGGARELDLKRYTPEFVYGAFLDNLKSEGLRRDFFDANDLVSHYLSGSANKNVDVDRIFDTRFNKNLQVHVEKDNPSFVTVSLSDTDPELAAQWLNQIIGLANKRTLEQLVSNIDAAIQLEINQVHDQLASKLKLAEQRRRDRIIALKEALHVAKALGITDSNGFTQMLGKAQTGLAVNTAETPLYMRGADALEAEITVLESRKSDEPFIAGLRDLQERQTFLENISIDTDALSAVTLDSAAEPPYRAATPRKARTIILAAVLGILLGIFCVFVAELASRIRRELGRTQN